MNSKMKNLIMKRHDIAHLILNDCPLIYFFPNNVFFFEEDNFIILNSNSELQLVAICYDV